jgi:hypothetical protein
MSTQLAGHSVSVAGVVIDDHGRALLIQRGPDRRLQEHDARNRRPGIPVQGNRW